jgi:hypothetical protein
MMLDHSSANLHITRAQVARVTVWRCNDYDNTHGLA